MMFASALLFAAAIQAPIASPATESSPGRIGELGAKMLVVDDIDAFWRAWEEPTPPVITTTSTITRARSVHAAVVFHDCRAGSDGNCRLRVRFSMIGPNGFAYGTPVSAAAWEGIAPGPSLIPSLATIWFKLDPKDTLGKYTIRATLTDEVAGTSISLSQIVEAKADTTAEPTN